MKKILGEETRREVVLSALELTGGNIKTSLSHAEKAKTEFMSHPGVEGQLPGVGGHIVGTMIHNVMGSPDYKPLTKDMKLSEQLAHNHHSVMAAVSFDFSKVKSWITGGHEAKESPAPVISTGKPVTPKMKR